MTEAADERYKNKSHRSLIAMYDDGRKLNYWTALWARDAAGADGRSVRTPCGDIEIPTFGTNQK